MDSLVEELDRIIGELTKIRDNLKNGRMKELCAERRLALECYRLEYAFILTHHPLEGEGDELKHNDVNLNLL